jgi:peptide/nickel transport system permease protein
MARFILKRLLMMILVMMGVVLLVFSMIYFSPGKPEDYILGDIATAADKQAFRAENGLDRPFIVQYFIYLKNMTKGNLGISYTTRRPAIDEILERFAVTFKISLLSIAISIVVGIGTGVVSAVRQYSIWDNISRVLAIAGMSMPNFWLGLMLILLFSVVLGWLPSSGIATWKHWILPAITVGSASTASIMRMTRSSMLEAIRQDYIRTAKAKGQKTWVIIFVHAFRNAVIPIITIIGINFGFLLGGAAVVETVFAIPGLGKLIVDGIKVKNAPVVQGGIVFAAVVMSFINLAVDVLYAYADPRIRSQYTRPSNPSNKRKILAPPKEKAADV